MYFEPDNFYHIYNRGNNSQIIFFDDENYQYFVNKIKELVVPACHLLAYCLLPNHFHLLVMANKVSCNNYRSKTGKITEEQNLTKRIALLLSSYSQGVNRKRNRTGSLFQKKTKAKSLNESKSHTDYLTFYFQYIHQNTVMAGLVNKMENWPFSSFNEYARNDSTGLCDKGLAMETVNLDWGNFMEHSEYFLNDNMTKKIF